MKSPRDPEFLSASAVVILAFFLMVATYLRWLPLNFALGPYRFTHLLSWVGCLNIAVFTPVFYVLRRRYPIRAIGLVRSHVFSNLLSFLLISIHFSSQLSRSVLPEDRTGFVTYILLIILVASGVLHRFQILEKGRIYPPHRNRFVHISVTTSFYIVVIVHVLHTLRMI